MDTSMGIGWERELLLQWAKGTRHCWEVQGFPGEVGLERAWAGGGSTELIPAQLGEPGA